MKYLFFDLEYATSKNRKPIICEFGYVVTDENFNIIEKNNLIINPNIERDQWDKTVVDDILTRKVEDYEGSLKFDEYYQIISNLINESKCVFGFSAYGDVRAFNNNCKAYGLANIDFEFFDIQYFYQKVKSMDHILSLSNCLKDLGIEGDKKEHDAEADSFNSMLILKNTLMGLNLNIDELLKIYSLDIEHNKNFKIIMAESRRIAAKEKRKRKYNVESDEVRGIEKEKFLKFIQNVKPTKKEPQVLKGKKYCISAIYQYTHRTQMYNIVQLLCNKGGELVLVPNQCNVFIYYQTLKKNGQLRKCSRLETVKKANENGQNIKIITFGKFLDLIDISEEELDAMPQVSLHNRRHKETSKEKITIQQDDFNSNLGNLFGDLFAKLKEEIEN